jgi:hypothetical protein
VIRLRTTGLNAITLSGDPSPVIQAYQNKRQLYGILFRAAAETLRTIVADPKHLGAEIDFFAVLHTWGSNLLHHSHLHCVVPAAVRLRNGSQWIACRDGFFLSVRVRSRLFRRLFLEELVNAFDAGKLEFFSSLEPLREPSSFLNYLAPLREAEWVHWDGQRASFFAIQETHEALARKTLLKGPDEG